MSCPQKTAMNAMVFDRYGAPDVLASRTLDVPRAGDHDVLVRVEAAGANRWDARAIRGEPRALRAVLGRDRPRRPLVPGSDIAGQVVAVGAGVRGFAPGDRVYAAIEGGGCADYAAVPARSLARAPANLGPERAAAVPTAALAALQALRDGGGLRPGRSVLVHGASGGVGTFAVQLARWSGACEVVGVCSTRNVDMVQSLGADHAFDYTREDVTRCGERFDVVIDAVGNRSLAELRRVVAPGGALVRVGGGCPLLGRTTHRLEELVLSRVMPLRVVAARVRRDGRDLATLTGLIEGGAVTPVIDRTFTMARTADAVRYLEHGHARGNVVVTVAAPAAAESRRRHPPRAARCWAA